MLNKLTINHSPEVANTVSPYMAAILADHYQDRLREAKSREEHHFLKQQFEYHKALSESFN